MGRGRDGDLRAVDRDDVDGDGDGDGVGVLFSSSCSGSTLLQEHSLI